MDILNQINIEVLSIRKVLLLLGVLIVVDVVTGVLNAILSKEVESTRMKQGAVGKVYEMAIVSIAILLDRVFMTKYVIGISTTIFYIVQEGLSILENTGKYISYPEFIKNIFIKLNNKGE